MRSYAILLLVIALGTLQPSTHAADPISRTTPLPVYALPDSAKADGNLTEWAGVPAAVPAGALRHVGRDEKPAPTDDAPPAVYLGRRAGSPDLHVLVVVREPRTSTADSGGWILGDGLELFFDLKRAERDAKDPKWHEDPKKWEYAPGMNRLGLMPRGPVHGPQQFWRWLNKGVTWVAEYDAVPLEGGGVAYEVRLDGASALKDLKMDALPETIGLAVAVTDADHAVVLEAGGWSNRGGTYRLFGDATAGNMPNSYGLVATAPQPIPAGGAVSQLPRTLRDLYDARTEPAAMRAALAELQPPASAELVLWAASKRAKPDAELVRAAVALPDPRARENALAWLLATEPEEAVVKDAVRAAYAARSEMTPQALAYANLLNERYAVGEKPALLELIRHEDLTVAFTASRAFGVVAGKEDVGAFDAAVEAVTKRLGADPARAAELAAAGTLMRGPLDEVKFRASIVEPKVTPVREVLAQNTDLPRLMPLDGNNLYNGANLARAWPAGGPKELWRLEIGGGNSGVVEAGGRAFVLVNDDYAQEVLCLDAASGKELWRTEVATSGGDYAAVTPVLDGGRVYVVPEGGAIQCLNGEDGQVVWANEELRGSTFSIPLVVGDTLYVSTGDAAITALEKTSGSVRWKSEKPGASPNSPALQVLDGVAQIVIGAGGGAQAEVRGIDAKTGAVFWRLPVRNDFGLCASPVAAGSRVVITSGRAGQDFYTCLQMVVRDGKVQAGPLYTRRDVQLNWANTPAVIDGAVYGFSNGSLDCTDLATGRPLWRSRNKGWQLSDHLIAADGLLFAFSRNGDLVLAEASKSGYRELGRVPTKIEPGQQQPSLANGRLYVRGAKWLVCYDVTAAANAK